MLAVVVPTPANACSLVLAALLTAGLGARVLVPRVGDALALNILAAASALRATGSRVSEAETALPRSEVAVSIAAGSGDDRGQEPSPGRAHTSAGLDIPAERLAHLNARQLRGIGATDAVDPGGHPLGARLSGVGSLGVGLADGDVVTSIDGRPTPTAAEGTAAALASYGSGEGTAHATVLRGGRTLHVTVHIPARAGAKGVR